jgi:hypothetical protein
MGESPSKSSEMMSEELPLYGKLFRSVYKAVPQFKFSFVIVSALFLISVRFISNKVLESVFGWPVDDVTVTDRAASSVPAIVHSSLLCPGLITVFLLRKYNPTEHISKGSAEWQDLVNALLQFCTGYMVNDTFMLVLRAQQSSGSWIPTFPFGDQLFLVHHFMTTTYMTQAQIYKAGHMSAMMCMLLGELSNPFHNAYYISAIGAQLDCCNGTKSQQFEAVIPVIFSVVYIVLRVLIAPPIMLYTTWNLLTNKQGRQDLPLFIRLFWTFMIWAVIFGSIPEIMTCKDILTKSFSSGEQQEL